MVNDVFSYIVKGRLGKEKKMENLWPIQHTMEM